MANNLDRIVAVNIEIAAPAIDSANFDNLLIFGPAPQVPPTRPLPAVGRYSDLAEVVAAGYSPVGANADPVGVAARIAFSQTPRPNQILIAAMQAATPSVEDKEIKIITAENYFTDAIGADPEGTLPSDLPWLQITYKRRPVSAMDVFIEKDDVVVYGNTLPTTMNANAYLQVALGESSDPNADQMGLDPSEFAGTFRVTLTGTAVSRYTTVASEVVFDGTSAFTPGAVTKTVNPEMMSPVETLKMALDTTGWYVACAAGIEESWYQQCAELIEANTKLFTYTFLSEADPVSDIFYRSHGWCGLIRLIGVGGGL